MSVSRRIFIRDGVATVTLGLAAPSFLSAIAHAQGNSEPAPRRRLSGRRQRLTQHADRVSRRGVLQPASVDCGACGAGAAGGHRRLRDDDGSASAAGRSAEHLQRGASGARAAHRLPELEPLALRGASDIWGTANPQMSTGSGWLGRYLDTLPRPLDALAAWNTTGETPRALLSGHIRRAGDSEREHIHVRKPEPRCGRAAGASGRADDGGQPGCGPSASGLPEQRQSRSDRNARSRGAASQYTPTVVYPNNGFAQSLRTVAGAIVRGIGSRVYWVDDRRLRHACGAGRWRWRRLRQSDGHAGRRPGGVLHRHPQPGPGAPTRPSSSSRSSAGACPRTAAREPTTERRA